jgi:hypothetical protein
MVPGPNNEEAESSTVRHFVGDFIEDGGIASIALLHPQGAHACSPIEPEHYPGGGSATSRRSARSLDQYPI